MPRKKGRKSTDAQLQAVKKYQSKMAEIKVRVKPEEKEGYQKAAEAYAADLGKPVSLNSYIKRAMEGQITRDALRRAEKARQGQRKS